MCRVGRYTIYTHSLFISAVHLNCPINESSCIVYLKSYGEREIRLPSHVLNDDRIDCISLDVTASCCQWQHVSISNKPQRLAADNACTKCRCFQATPDSRGRPLCYGWVILSGGFRRSRAGSAPLGDGPTPSRYS